MDLKNIKAELLKVFASMNASTDKVWTADELKISDKAVGGKVEVINPDGTLAPIEDGDHTMEDGTKFTIKDGVVSNWNGETEKTVEEPAAMAEPEETPAEEGAESPADEVKEEDETAKQIESIQGEIDALKTSIEEIKSMVQGFSSKEDVAYLSTQLEGFNKVLQPLVGIPAQFSQTNNSPVYKDAMEEKLEKLNKAATLWGNRK